MTRIERKTQYALAKYLRQQGYNTYADILLKFELHFHSPRYPFAAMVDTDDGIVYINPAITDREDISMLLRHEILHVYLAHQKRILKHFAKLKGLEWTQFDDIPLEAIMSMSDEDINKLADGIKQGVITDRQIARDLYGTKYKGYPLHNYIADLEIDNRGYTDNDKRLVRDLVINGIPMHGLLVDELEPQWAGLSVEQMLDDLEDEIKKEQENLGDQQNQNGGGEGQESQGQGQEGQGSQGQSGQGGQGQEGEGQEGEGQGNQGGQNQSGDQKGQGSRKSGSQGNQGQGNQDQSGQGQSGQDSGQGDAGKQPTWKEIKANLDDILANLDQMSDVEKQEIVNQLVDHINEVDREVLEKEVEERNKQLEQEIDDYDPDSEDAEARIKEIAKDINDEASIQNLIDETEEHVYADRAKRNKEKKEAEKNAKNYKTNSVEKLVLDLNKLIAKEVREIPEKTWGRMNKKAEGSGLMKKGTRMIDNPEIPVLAVYFDQSGSWDASDIQVGNKVIETLNSYVKKGQLKIQIYYFADDVGTSPNGIGSGTGAGAKLMQHIKKTRPDNVLIMTDSDFDHWGEIRSENGTRLKGGAFLLFRNGEISRELIQRVRGKKFTGIYST